MSSFQLYMAPGTCARVSCIALEEARQDFETVLIRFMRGEHKSPEYRKLNPKGKVPTLVVDGDPLTENVAILSHLNQKFREANLLPTPRNEFDRLRQLADLCFCSSTLHPIVTRIRMPHLFAPDEVARSVWERACQAMNEYFQLIDERLNGHSWWYGEQWSVVDAYLYWVYWRTAGANYDVSTFKHFQQHAQRMEERPSTGRALTREAKLQAQLESEGLAFVPPSIK